MTVISKKDLGDDNLRVLGSHFHWARAERVLSLTEAAKLTNCNEQTLELIEIGAIDLDMNIIVKLLQFYDLKLILQLEGQDD